MRRVVAAVFGLFILGIANDVIAQTVILEKMEIAIEDENYQRVIKLAEDAFEDKETKKMPAAYYLYAIACKELSEDEIYFGKNPDIMKEGVKAVIKGIGKDDNKNEYSRYEKEMDAVADRYNQLGDAQYNINKPSKAIKIYDGSYSINANRYSYLMMGKCALETYDTARGEAIFKDLIQMYNNDPESDEDAEQSFDPFIYFIDKYYTSRNYDSANYFISNGRVVLGENSKFDFYQKQITLNQIKTMPPSSMMLDRIQQAVIHNKTDKDLLHKENAVYVYLIKNAVLNYNLEQADTLLKHFVNEKVARSTDPEASKIKSVDEFVLAKPENVLWKLSEYFQIYGHIETGNYLLDKYMLTTAASPSENDIAARWAVISQYAYDTKEFPFAAFILRRAIEKYPSNEKLKDLRRKMIADKENERTNVEEQGFVYLLMQDEYGGIKEFGIANDPEITNRLIRANEKYIGLLTAANRMPEAYAMFEELQFYAPEIDRAFRLEQMAKDDFYNNYYLTKTKGKDQGGREKVAFTWLGSTSDCEPGIIPDEIHEKVRNRINYFRRNAGVPEVVFDEATNEYCQKAALMMTANNNLSHEPPKTWRCYSDEGAYAAKHSLIIKDANTSMGVTYIMADKNPSAGNRRWLLYPNGKIYGHGSTNDITVIWALDDSGSTDTTAYMDSPIVWPPDGYVPQMLLFDNWTFGLYRDLKEAKVVVTQDGKEIPVEVEKFVKGYGAPTLVFKPAINKAALPESSVFNVKVTLSNGSNYSYTVNSFAYDPNR